MSVQKKPTFLTWNQYSIHFDCVFINYDNLTVDLLRNSDCLSQHALEHRTERWAELVENIMKMEVIYKLLTTTTEWTLKWLNILFW